MVLTPRFFLLWAIGILLAVVSLWEPMALWLSFGLTLAVVAAAAADFILARRQSLSVERQAPHVLTQGQPTEVTLRLENRGWHMLSLEVRDSPPVVFVVPEEAMTLRLRGRSHEDLKYTVRSYRRGEFSFGDVFIRVTGPLGLVKRQQRLPAPQPVVVFPDMSAAGARDLALLLASPQTAGQRRTPARGEGREFESLREYQRDDEYRYIDWKATAKRGMLISRQFQTERDQRLLIMVDLGRLMAPKIGPYQKLDYAVNAAVRLAQTALFKGDMVGLLLFSQEIAFYLPPRKGAGQLAAIVQALVSAEPRRLEPNYRLVFNYAARRNSRRTLMVCFTDVLDIDISQSLVEGMAPLLPRHLAMTVTVSDSDVLHLLQQVPDNAHDVYRHLAAQGVWEDYQRTMRALASRGVMTVNVPAQDLTVATINRYLEIKRTARL